jgi:hypothetical protein
MKSVENYTRIDLSDESTVVKALMDQVAVEAQQSSMTLSGAGQAYNARQPSNLTPAMAAWYSRYIGGVRVAAIAEVSSAFQGDVTPDGNGKSLYIEFERDKVKTKSLNAAISDAARFADKHKVDVENFERCKQEFSNLRQRLDRQPTRTNKWLYVFGLFAVVLLEAFINFESFLKVPYITSPFLATGATLAVGFGVGFAAHFHGVVFKQWNFLFSPQEAAEQGHLNRRKDAIKRLTIGGILLLVALMMVGGSRYYYLREYIVQAQILGGSPPSMFGGIAFMLLGNIVAYIIGLLIAYSMHDAHPIYAERDRELRQATVKQDSLKKMRSEAQMQLRQGTDAELKHCANQDASARGPRYAELRDLADKIVNKDQEVAGALLSYRNALVAALGAKGANKMFRQPEGSHDLLLPTGVDVVISGEEYASLPLTLGFTV